MNSDFGRYRDAAVPRASRERRRELQGRAVDKGVVTDAETVLLVQIEVADSLSVFADIQFGQQFILGKLGIYAAILARCRDLVREFVRRRVFARNVGNRVRVVDEQEVWEERLRNAFFELRDVFDAEFRLPRRKYVGCRHRVRGKSIFWPEGTQLKRSSL